MKANDRWQARIAVFVTLGMYLFLPQKLTLGPAWAVPVAVVVALLVPLIVLSPMGRNTDARFARGFSIAMIAVLNAINIYSAARLINDLVNAHAKYHGINGPDLLRNGAIIWAFNVIVFALWFWELDSDGPASREKAASVRNFIAPDFLFPQMTVDPKRVGGYEEWKPSFVDYLYVSFTNALAISPTDTMPLSHWAKMLMLFESLISFGTVALILARSVNILS